MKESGQFQQETFKYMLDVSNLDKRMKLPPIYRPRHSKLLDMQNQANLIKFFS